MKNNVLIVDNVIEDKRLIDFLIDRLADDPIPMNTFIEKNDIFQLNANNYTVMDLSY